MSNAPNNPMPPVGEWIEEREQLLALAQNIIQKWEYLEARWSRAYPGCEDHFPASVRELRDSIPSERT